MIRPPRPITQADCPAVAALIRLAFSHQSRPTDPPPNALKETPESLAALLARGGGGAMMDGIAHPVGAVLWEEKEGGLYFGRLAVHPAARRWSVARALVAAVEDEARDRGLPRVHAGVRLVLADNRRLFASLGYVETVASAHPGYGWNTTVAIEKRLVP